MSCSQFPPVTPASSGLLSRLVVDFFVIVTLITKISSDDVKNSTVAEKQICFFISFWLQLCVQSIYSGTTSDFYFQ